MTTSNLRVLSVGRPGQKSCRFWVEDYYGDGHSACVLVDAEHTECPLNEHTPGADCPLDSGPILVVRGAA